jgi:hypothetical protein
LLGNKFSTTTERAKMKLFPIYVSALLLSACSNPGEISDDYYAKYKELGPPKILYSCDKGETPGFDLEASMACAATARDDTSFDLVACLEKTKRKKEPIIDIGYVAGVEVAVTYNELLRDAKADCDGKFKILQSEK